MSYEKQLREALAELVDFIKINKRNVLSGMTRRETDFLMEALHKANVALLKSEV